MTGGPSRAEAINARLAEAAQHLGVALAVGSQRAAIEGGASGGLDRTLRRRAPDTVILSNIGAAQLTRGFGLDEARRAMDMIDADALVVHLNPLQEACQPEGDRDWWGVGAALEALILKLEAPVVVKETGAGLSGRTARRLIDMGAAAVDVAGAGGTNWALVEGERASGPVRQGPRRRLRRLGRADRPGPRGCAARLPGGRHHRFRRRPRRGGCGQGDSPGRRCRGPGGRRPGGRRDLYRGGGRTFSSR